MIDYMAMVNYLILMDLHIKETGKMINKMDMELNHGLINRNIKEISKMVRKTEKDDLFGLMALTTKETFEIILQKASGPTNGQTIVNTPELGKQTKCTVMEFSSGLTEEYSQDNMKMITNKEKANTLGPMGKFMKGIGLLVNSTAMES